MRFDLKRTTATFGVFHPRNEKNKGMACDIPFRCTVGVEMIEMLMPAQRQEGEDENPTAFIDELFSAEGYVRRPSINPIRIHRKPEGALVEIYDTKSESKNGKPLKLEPCTLNKLEITLQSPHQLVLTGQIQYSKYDDKELTRINALNEKSFDMTIFIEQADMFDSPPSNDDQGEDGGNSEQSENGEDNHDDEDRDDDDSSARGGEPADEEDETD